MLKKLALLLLLCTPAQAQTVTQSGTVTAGHAVRWVSNGVVGDGGTAANGLLTSLGVTNNGGPGICLSSAPLTAAARNQLCFAVTTNGGSKISSYIYGTATNPGITFDINGSVQGFPAVTLPVTSGDGACLDGTTGLLKDCGFIPQALSAVRVIASGACTIATSDTDIQNATGAAITCTLPASPAANEEHTVFDNCDAGLFPITITATSINGAASQSIYLDCGTMTLKWLATAAMWRIK